MTPDEFAGVPENVPRGGATLGWEQLYLDQFDELWAKAQAGHGYSQGLLEAYRLAREIDVTNLSTTYGWDAQGSRVNALLNNMLDYLKEQHSEERDPRYLARAVFQAFSDYQQGYAYGGPWSNEIELEIYARAEAYVRSGALTKQATLLALHRWGLRTLADALGTGRPGTGMD